MRCEPAVLHVAVRGGSVSSSASFARRVCRWAAVLLRMMHKHAEVRFRGPTDVAPCTPWAGADDVPRFASLDTDLTCDVCVVGAGVSGLAVGLELAERGRDVAVVDARGIGNGQTARSSAHLVTALDERYFVLEHRYGPEMARAAAGTHARAIDWIRRAVDRHRIDCGLEEVPGLLVVPEERIDDADALLGAERAAAMRAGVRCSMVGRAVGLPGAFGPEGLLFRGQAQVHPVRLLAGLAGAFARCGGRLFCHSPVRSMRTERGGVVMTTSEGSRVRAKHVVLATHEVPSALSAAMRPMRPKVSFVVAYEWREIDRFLLWDGYWDSATPYHYVRTAQCTESGTACTVLIVGGEDEPGMNPGNAAASYEKLERWTRTRFEPVGRRRWAWWGRIQEPQGEFALIGSLPGWPGVSVVTGDSGNGMTYAGIAAVRVADQIDGLPVPLVEDRMFDPAARANDA